MQIHTLYLAPFSFENELRQELLRNNIPIIFEKDRLFAVGTPHAAQCAPKPSNEPSQATTHPKDDTTPLQQALPALRVADRGKNLCLCGWHADVYHPMWADNIWYSPQIIPIQSIGDAVKKLKAIQRNWVLYSTEEHRRSNLIQDQLPKVAAKPIVFGQQPFAAPLGSWTLLSHDAIIASPYCSSPFPHGRIEFVENKEIPPNRAYLKLWEAFTRLGIHPTKEDLCLDLGSSPGGWSWVLAELGAHVFSIDKAPLAEHIGNSPNIEHCIGSAFAIEPEWIGNADWILSDVACYPDRLLRLVTSFVQHTPHCNMLCTIKLAGETDFAALDEFLQIPHSFICHLHVNKHEVTWVYLGKERQ